MVRKLLLITFFFSALSAIAAAQENNRLPSENEIEARLIRYKLIQTKEINPETPDNEFLTQITSDTWGLFRDIVDRQTGLPANNVIVFSTYSIVSGYTSVTDIGLYMMCVVGAHDLKFITRNEAINRLDLVLNSLGKMEKYHGDFYNYYRIDNLENTMHYVSAVDSGWLAAGLIVAKQSFPEALGEKCDGFIGAMNFGIFYDKKLGHLSLGVDANKEKASEFTYGLLNTEPRLASYIAIAKGDVPVEHWFRLNRTLPREWKWQQQQPRGTRRIYAGYKVFEGYYRYKDFKYVPSWGGSMFEFLMPSLVMKENELGPKSFGLNNKTAVQMQIYYALEENGYPVWGISPCSIPDDPFGYREYGVKWMGVKGYGDERVVTPHATFLALEIDPEKSLKNLKELSKYSNIYGTYGFFDSLNFESEQVNTKYIALDQAMSFIALCNYLNKGSIRDRFHSEPMIKKNEYLLTVEEFF